MTQNDFRSLIEAMSKSTQDALEVAKQVNKSLHDIGRRLDERDAPKTGEGIKEDDGTNISINEKFKTYNSYLQSRSPLILKALLMQPKVKAAVLETYPHIARHFEDDNDFGVEDVDADESVYAAPSPSEAYLSHIDKVDPGTLRGLLKHPDVAAAVLRAYPNLTGKAPVDDIDLREEPEREFSQEQLNRYDTYLNTAHRTSLEFILRKVGVRRAVVRDFPSLIGRPHEYNWYNDDPSAG